jgi:lipopolysaccharide export system protein LptC
MKMRKKVFMAVIVVAIVVVSGWNVSQSKSEATLSIS